LIYLLDMNVLRSDALEQRIRTEPDALFVLPDTAFVEMLKHDKKWEATMHGSLARLVPIVDRTFVAMSVSEALRFELVGSPADRDSLLALDQRPMREMICAIADRDDRRAAEIRGQIQELRPRLMAEQINADAEKRKVMGLVQTLAKALKPSEADDLRAGRMERSAILALILRRCERMRKCCGVPEALVSAVPMAVRIILLEFWNMLEWTRLGGLDGANPSKNLNDRFDREYVVVGSFFDAMLTQDTKARNADNDLRRMLDGSRRDEIFAAYREYLSRRRARLRVQS
jgi:hypothetical protein